MNSATGAMFWELWRLNRGDLVLRICYSVGSVLLLAAAIKLHNKSELLELSGGLALLVSSLAGLISAVWIRQLDRHQGSHDHQLGFVRPISTARLLAAPMLFSVFTSALCFAIPILLFQSVTQQYLAFWQPLALVTSLSICLTAATWGTSKTVDKLLGVVLVFCLLAIVLYRQHHRVSTEPFFLVIGRPEFFHTSNFSLAVVALFAGVAWLATLWSLDKQRHGDYVGVCERLWELLPNWPEKTLGSLRFSNPRHAQIAFEFKRVAPTVFSCGLLASAFMFTFTRFTVWLYPHAAAPKTAFEGAPALIGIGIAVSPLIFHVIGVHKTLGLRRNQSTWRLCDYDAVQPVSNFQWVSSKLWVIAICSMIAWSMMWVAATVYVCSFTVNSLWLEQISSINQATGPLSTEWWVTAAMCLVFTYAVLSTAIMAMGLWMPIYPKHFFVGCILAYINFALMMLDAAKGWQYTNLWQFYAIVLALATLGLTVTLIRRAWVNHFIPQMAMIAILGTSFIYVTVVIRLANELPIFTSLPIAIKLFLASLLLWPTLTTIATPLALADQRHR